MKRLLLLLVVIALPLSAQNIKLTPGVVRKGVTKKEVCETSTTAFRHTTQKMKEDVCLAYGVKQGCPGKGYELDHLISIELGGADDERNLWPEPYPEAHVKDLVENYLHRRVCKIGDMTIEQAQKKIVDWRSVLPLLPKDQVEHALKRK